jgi:hypothetical protein
MTHEEIMKKEESRFESMSRSIIRVPYDPKSISKDDMIGSYSQKGRPTTFNWNSQRKYREAISMIETGTTGVGLNGLLRVEEVALEDADDGGRYRGPRSVNNSVQNIQDESIGKIAQMAKEESLPGFGDPARGARPVDHKFKSATIKLHQIPGNDNHGRKGSEEYKVKAGYGDEDEVQDNEDIILGSIKETQNEHFESQPYGTTGRILEIIGLGVENEISKIKGLLSPFPTPILRGRMPVNKPSPTNWGSNPNL